MVLAAGLGTRLRPLTNDRPKALVEIDGVPLLEIVLRRLEEAGCDEITVNGHHFAEQLADYLIRRQKRCQTRLHFSWEREEPLETGGGLWQARDFFTGPEPFLVHNVDVLSDLPLADLMAAHRAGGAVATLAVQARPSRRCLAFARDGQLLGRWSDQSGNSPTREIALPLAFCGIQAVSPRWFDLVEQPGPFALVDHYVRLAQAGHRISAWHADAWRWRDAGRPEHLAPL